MKKEKDIFEVVPIVATTLDDAWFQTLLAVVNNGYTYHIDQGSYVGQYRLQCNLSLLVKFPWMEPKLPLMPEGSNLPPPEDEDHLNEYLPYLLTAAKKPNEDYTYGLFLNGYEYFKTANRNITRQIVDQVKISVEMIAKNLGTNQAVMSVCDPQSILLKDPPCLRQIQLQVIKGQLCFILFWRSWDLCNGLPGNLAAIQALKELMLFDINNIRRTLQKEELQDGPIIAYTSGGHIYDHAFDLVEQRLMLGSGSIKKTHGLV